MAGGEQTYEPVREVRLAIVMYGGVSLAIYINGVAQELERLVRATAPRADRKDLYVGDEDLASTDRVYREIGRRLGGEDADKWVKEGGQAGAPVLTRFVVDILSGTSAGGINAIYLAKAMANGQTIKSLRDLWIDKADINQLLNEAEAYEDLDGAQYTDPPKSLLASQRLYVLARRALEEMGAKREDDAPHYADQVDLVVTTTDLQGLTMQVQLADGPIEEPRHRTLLEFGYVAKNPVGDDRNEFVDRDELLAFAARATSSFPFAFEPAVLSDAMGQPLSGDLADHADSLFADYARIHAKYTDFAFADGGYLDNKPFTGATETLRRRRADVPVSRKLLFVEPDPTDPAKWGDPRKAKPPPNAIGNIADALVKLPRFEPIRQDIAAIADRNDAVRRVREVTRDIQLKAIAPGVNINAPDVLRLAYLRLRRVQVIADLAELVARTSRRPPSADEQAAIHQELEKWAPNGDVADIQEFLDDYDLRYRMRVIALLQDRINELMAGGEEAAHLLAAAGRSGNAGDLAEQGADWLRDLKKELSRILAQLRRDGREVRRRTLPGPHGATAPDTVVDAATDLTQTQETEQAEALGAALKEHFSGRLETADGDLAKALAKPAPDRATDLRAVLTSYHECVGVIDMAIFPLTYPDLGETNPVDVYRISPVDAGQLVEPTEATHKLAGVAVGHFGGFLDQGWRRNDLMWGRLDGAERLIDVLVPDEGERTRLRIQAQAQILREEITGPGDGLADLLRDDGPARLRKALAKTGNDREVVDIFHDCYRGPNPRLPSDITMGLAARGAAISGDMLEGIAEDRGPVARALAAVVSAAAHALSGGVGLAARLRAGRARVRGWIKAHF